MSSFTRTLQKRALKRMGFHRQLTEVRLTALGVPFIHRFRKGEGPILAPNGEKVGQHYPRIG